MSQDRDEAITIRADLGGGVQGFLVIDTTVQNGSSGGLRVAPDLTEREVSTLAREMTLKFSFIGRPSGGAKSGVRIAAEAGAEEKRRLLRDFGRHLGPLIRRGVYSPGTDINCGPDDLRAVYAGAGMQLRAPTDTALFTAIGAAEAVSACREVIARPTRIVRVAIEGFGSVAAWLARRLPPSEYAITAISTVDGTVVKESGFDPAELVDKKARFGDALVEHLEGTRGSHDAVFSAECDIFVPSARTWSLSAERAREVRARYVVPIANAPYGEGAVDVLERAGIVCLPGFVVNCGGVFASSLFDSGVPLGDVETLARREFHAVLRALLDARSDDGVSPMALAEAVALERLRSRSSAIAREPRYTRIARRLTREYLPRSIYGQRYLGRFSRNLVDLEKLIRRSAHRPPDARASTGT